MLRESHKVLNADDRLLFVVLLHSPMVDRTGREVTTAVTNLDIHDIARSCKTYGVTRYFIVNPEVEQERVVGAILKHWQDEVSKVYHPSREKALALVRFVRTFEEAYNQASLEASQGHHGNEAYLPRLPYVVMPDARDLSKEFPPGSENESWSYEKLKWCLKNKRIPGDEPQRQILRPLMIVFGTGWGIAPAFFSQVDRALKPLKAEQEAALGYNHLSVRAAAAIVLDRLFGDRGDEICLQ